MDCNISTNKHVNKPNQTIDSSSLVERSQLYDKIRVLGRGAFGTATVYRKRVDNSLVVLKEIDLLKFKSNGKKAFALNEAKIMYNLNHINVIKFHQAFIDGSKLIIEMEYAKNGTLAAHLSTKTEHLEEQEVLILFKQIASGLAYLHSKRIFHSDLKMANIFLSSEFVVKIGDFGISKKIVDKSKQQQKLEKLQTDNQVADASIMSSSLFSDIGHLGTLAYSSREQFLGGRVDFKSDIWALGCILYELITLKQLFQAESLSMLVMSITKIKYAPINRPIMSQLQSLFEQMIAELPADRPTAFEVEIKATELLKQIQLTNQSYIKYQNKWSRGGNRKSDLCSSEALMVHPTKDIVGNPTSLVYQVRLDTRHVSVERVNLPNSKRIRQIVKGSSHYLVLTYDCFVYGWGSKSSGQLGACGLASHTQKSLLPNTSGRGFIGLGFQQSSIPQRSSKISPTRRDIKEALRISKPTERPFPISELSKHKIIKLSAGHEFSVFLTKSGIVMTCGNGSFGCLGHGDFESSFMPTLVQSLLNKDIISIACGLKHVVVVSASGQAFSWGKNTRGRLGIQMGGPMFGTRKRTYVTDEMSTSNSTASDQRLPRYINLPQLIKLPADNKQVATEAINFESVFCGDKCSILVDDCGRCWAFGDNAANRLSLDLPGTLLRKQETVEYQLEPKLITALSKYRVVNISIGRKHCCFLTEDQKLIVCGQDVDRKYQVENNLINLRDCHRQISLQLRTKARNREHQTVTNMNQFKSNITPQKEHRDDNEQQCSKTINKRKKPSWRGSFRKIPLDSIAGVACSSQFTLVQTEQNRIYFWGIRSYLESGSSMMNPTARNIIFKRKKHDLNIEPQLVASCADDCLVKIGTTNDSLMGNIQNLGSDQPIIHLKDPQLVANSLADLWVLDYRKISSSSSSSSSSVNSLSIYNQASIQDDQYLSSSLESCCSICCSYMDDDEDDNDCDARHEHITTLNETSKRAKIKHDVILEPQPIVSLYIPSMFCRQTNSLHLSEIFCFEDDRFYVVLDTTFKPRNLSISTSVPSISSASRILHGRSSNQQTLEPRDYKQQQLPMLIVDECETSRSSSPLKEATKLNPSSSSSSVKSTLSGLNFDTDANFRNMIAKSCSNKNNSSSENSPSTEATQIIKIRDKIDDGHNDDVYKEVSTETETLLNFQLSKNNNMESKGNSRIQTSNLNTGRNIIVRNGTNNSLANEYGEQLSLSSLFMNNSNSNIILNSKQLKSNNKKNRIRQLVFENSPPSNSSVGKQQVSLNNKSINLRSIPQTKSKLTTTVGLPISSSRRRPTSKISTTLSPEPTPEATTFANELSSMPSWVRNEFLFQEQDNNNLAAIACSTNQDRLIKARSLNESQQYSTGATVSGSVSSIRSLSSDNIHMLSSDTLFFNKQQQPQDSINNTSKDTRNKEKFVSTVTLNNGIVICNHKRQKSRRQQTELDELNFQFDEELVASNEGVEKVKLDISGDQRSNQVIQIKYKDTNSESVSEQQLQPQQTLVFLRVNPGNLPTPSGNNIDNNNSQKDSLAVSQVTKLIGSKSFNSLADVTTTITTLNESNKKYKRKMKQRPKSTDYNYKNDLIQLNERVDAFDDSCMRKQSSKSCSTASLSFIGKSLRKMFC